MHKRKWQGIYFICAHEKWDQNDGIDDCFSKIATSLKSINVLGSIDIITRHSLLFNSKHDNLLCDKTFACMETLKFYVFKCGDIVINIYVKLTPLGSMDECLLKLFIFWQKKLLS